MNDVVWVSKNIGSFSLQFPDTYKIQYLYEDSMSGILGNENIKINFATGYSPIIFENRPEQVVLSVDTNETIIRRIIKFKMNNALILGHGGLGYIENNRNDSNKCWC